MNTTTTNHVAAIGKIYDAFVQGDINFILSLIDDNCKWIGTGEGFLPAGGTYKGKDAVNFFMKLGETLDFKAFTPLQINAINDNEVIALGNMSTIARKTGKALATDWAMHWKFNEAGKIVYYHDYFDSAPAYAALQP